MDQTGGQNPCQRYLPLKAGGSHMKTTVDNDADEYKLRMTETLKPCWVRIDHLNTRKFFLKNMKLG